MFPPACRPEFAALDAQLPGRRCSHTCYRGTSPSCHLTRPGRRCSRRYSPQSWPVPHLARHGRHWVRRRAAVRHGGIGCYLRLLGCRILFDLGAHRRHHRSLVRHHGLPWPGRWQRFGLTHGGRSFPLDALRSSRNGLLNQLGIYGRLLQQSMGGFFHKISYPP